MKFVARHYHLRSRATTRRDVMQRICPKCGAATWAAFAVCLQCFVIFTSVGRREQITIAPEPVDETVSPETLEEATRVAEQDTQDISETPDADVEVHIAEAREVPHEGLTDADATTTGDVEMRSVGEPENEDNIADFFERMDEEEQIDEGTAIPPNLIPPNLEGVLLREGSQAAMEVNVVQGPMPEVINLDFSNNAAVYMD